MNEIHISLFGKLRVESADRVARTIEPRRAEELLCYLLLYRDRLHEREKVATLLWPDASPDHSKRYLRQTLWQLQSTLNDDPTSACQLLTVDHARIGINPRADYWLDIALFEQTFVAVEDKPGRAFCEQQADGVHRAVQLYKGELLEGWYQDWCIYERERFQTMYMALLDKLLTYSEAHAEYEAGLDYGAQILRYDRARERTHRQLMRLHYLAGNRTAAIHQYESCVAALRAELDVPPAQSTIALYEQICTGYIHAPPPVVKPILTLDPVMAAAGNQAVLADAIHQVEQIQTTLAHLQAQVTQLAQNLRQEDERQD